MRFVAMYVSNLPLGVPEVSIPALAEPSNLVKSEEKPCPDHRSESHSSNRKGCHPLSECLQHVGGFTHRLILIKTL